MSIRQPSRKLLQALRCYSTAPTTSHLKPLTTLPDASLATFREHAFEPALPALLPRSHFLPLMPAIEKWFTSDGVLDTTYLSTHSDMTVTMELTETSDEARVTRFERFEAPFSIFLTHMSSSSLSHAPANSRLYIAQHPLASLPLALQEDVPTPGLVRQAGKGDVYASSIWLGLAPTNTPLHRDPNPNIFVQLAGKKRVRVYEPGIGDEVLALVNGGKGKRLRGEEMMHGAERDELDKMIWGSGRVPGWEAEVLPGDGLFIPKRWWHSVRSAGDGVVGSVNWWFR